MLLNTASTLLSLFLQPWLLPSALLHFLRSQLVELGIARHQDLATREGNTCNVANTLQLGENQLTFVQFSKMPCLQRSDAPIYVYLRMGLTFMQPFNILQQLWNGNRNASITEMITLWMQQLLCLCDQSGEATHLGTFAATSWLLPLHASDILIWKTGNTIPFKQASRKVGHANFPVLRHYGETGRQENRRLPLRHLTNHASKEGQGRSVKDTVVGLF